MLEIERLTYIFINQKKAKNSWPVQQKREIGADNQTITTTVN